MKATLIRFRVTKFRSIQDSGWINAGDITCLVGTNESGKTNVLMGLYKLKPANGEEINLLADLPRAEYSRLKNSFGEVVFIESVFQMPDEAGGGEIKVSRRYDGTYQISGQDADIETWQSPYEVSKNPFWASIPSFVYYSDYGNLDSAIHLPEVVRHLETYRHENIGEKLRARTRTLKVLFEFLQLSPQEIQQMGNENPQANAANIEADQLKKTERDILLTSAATELTKSFRGWWKQGNYRFRFAADGNFFRIWVSDEVRAEDIELENRSRGLQWFFSFFLVFLVESRGDHNNCILLLDEPGLTLHPMAQFDLIKFFESLSVTNQIMYTTHSPFMVDADHIGDVVAVYVAESGETKVSHDLREGNKDADKSIYPIHAAIGLTVSETLLLGCTPVLVEGPSDQIILNAIKNYLIKVGKYTYDRELVFIPTGGVKGVSSVKNILLGRDGELPYVLLDSDGPGLQKEKDLRSGAYKEAQDRVLGVKEITGMEDSEIEDLLPVADIVKAFSKRFRGKEEDFEDNDPDAHKPIVDQMEAFAKANGIALKLGWKVEIAKDIAKALRKSSTMVPLELLGKREQLFNTLTQK